MLIFEIEVYLLQLLKPRYDTLHIIINGLLNIIQHGLIYKINTPGFYVHRAEHINQ